MIFIHGVNRFATLAPESIEKIVIQASKILLCGEMGTQHETIQAIPLMCRRRIALGKPRNIQLQHRIPPVRQGQPFRILEHLVA